MSGFFGGRGGAGGFGPVVAIDRVVATNAGQLQAGNHVFMVGADAGQNSTGQFLYLIGAGAGEGLGIDHVILIGDDTLTQAVVAPNLTGTIAVGSNALNALTGTGSAQIVASPLIAIGRNAGKLLTVASSSVIIGDNALSAASTDAADPIRRCVIIGNEAVTTPLVTNKCVFDSVVIGYQAGSTTVDKGMERCVVLGPLAMNGYNANGLANLRNIVAIGYGAGSGSDGNGVGDQQNVFIGSLAGSGANTARSTLIGDGASCGIGNSNTLVGATTSVGNSALCTAVGYACAVTTGTSYLTAIGAECSGGGNASTFLGARIIGLSGARNIIIGYQAGTGEGANANRFIVETTDIGSRQCLLYGDMAAGNLIVGKSTPGVDRDMPGTNILKLLAGTNTGAPVGGGYFYCAGANNDLHWVNSAGVDTQLTP